MLLSTVTDCIGLLLNIQKKHNGSNSDQIKTTFTNAEKPGLYTGREALDDAPNNDSGGSKLVATLSEMKSELNMILHTQHYLNQSK